MFLLYLALQRVSDCPFGCVQVSHELLGTFDPHFVYTALTRAPEKLAEWDKLTDMLKDFMADQSETSYLSMERVAKFWRKLVERFPELIDFLALTDAQTREHFNLFAKALFQDFYLKKKVEPLQLYRFLNWRDRAPLAQWLAMTSDQDREFFTSFMTSLVRIARGDAVADSFSMKVRSKGKDSSFGRTLQRSQKLTRRQCTIVKEIEEGKDPLSHTAAAMRFRGATSVVRAAMAIRDHALQSVGPTSALVGFGSQILHLSGDVDGSDKDELLGEAENKTPGNDHTHPAVGPGDDP